MKCRVDVGKAVRREISRKRGGCKGKKEVRQESSSYRKKIEEVKERRRHRRK